MRVYLDAYVNLNATAFANETDETELSIYFTSTDTGETINSSLPFSEGQKWETFEFDFTDFINTNGDEFDEMSISFAKADVSGNKTKYFIDNLRGSINQYNKDSSLSSALLVSKSITSLMVNNDNNIIDNEMLMNMTMSPNPVLTSFTLPIEVINVTIYDITGSVQKTFDSNIVDFDVSELHPGFYILKANDIKGNSYSIHFVKK